MKKEIWESSIKEVSIEETVRDFCEEYGLSNIDINDFDSEFDDFIEDNIKEISPEEMDTLKEEIKKQLIKQKEEFIVQEKSKLKNRTSILEWVSELLDYMRSNAEIDPGDVGFLLSVDEIIDLIAQNGNKE